MEKLTDRVDSSERTCIPDTLTGVAGIQIDLIASKAHGFNASAERLNGRTPGFNGLG